MTRNKRVDGRWLQYHIRDLREVRVAMSGWIDHEKLENRGHHFPASIMNGEVADTSDFQVGKGVMHFDESFRYLGSMLHKTLTDQVDVDSRIKAAGAAFGALKDRLGGKTIPLSSKSKLYEAVVIGILLHGSEFWTLTKKLEARIQCFHNTCVRRMCRVNRWHTRHYRISQSQLEARLGVTPIAITIRRRQGYRVN